MPIRPLSKELQEVAEKELNEVPSRIQADLDHLREWISQQSHLKARTDDQWLLTFLRGTKFSLQRAKEKIDFYYSVRNLVPEFHCNRDPFLPEIQEVLEIGPILVLPKTAHSAGPRICLTRYHNVDPDKIKLDTLFKVLLMIEDILLLEDDNYVIAGQSLMVDLKHVAYAYITQLTLPYVKKIFVHLQDVLPIRVKEIQYINTPSAIVTIYNAIKFILTEKLRGRIFLHSEGFSETLVSSKNINTSILPKDYGGDEASCKELAAYWKKKVESYRDWFLEDEKYGTDESKRLQKSKTVDSMFGVEGSFIKLEID